MDELKHWCSHVESRVAQIDDQAIRVNCMAALRNLQEQYDDAIQFYNELLKLNPKDLTALNNLAFLVAANPKNPNPEQALNFIANAKYSFGPLPTLLDTEAQIHMFIAKSLKNKSPDQMESHLNNAVSLLNDAISVDPSGTNYFHLAYASYLKNDQRNAKKYWQRTGLDFKVSNLHRLEQPEYGELEKKFGRVQ